ncbi:hypothetical protein U1Q18_051295 [Sarracenia purpurea var. burkii]
MDSSVERWQANELYVPNIIPISVFTIGGHPLELRSPEDYSAYIWIPMSKVILGGTGIAWGFHVFTADTQTPEIRESWRNVLRDMIDLEPKVVIPGIIWARDRQAMKLSNFTLQYLEIFEAVLQENNYKNFHRCDYHMKELYPGLGLEGSLELSAKVNTGEMKF